MSQLEVNVKPMLCFSCNYFAKDLYKSTMLSRIHGKDRNNFARQWYSLKENLFKNRRLDCDSKQDDLLNIHE